jgi:hypothetical protein
MPQMNADFFLTPEFWLLNSAHGGASAYRAVTLAKADPREPFPRLITEH